MDNAFLYMAMLNYPYPTQFLKNLPGWPCNVSATYLNGVNQSTEDYNLFKAIREATNVYYNWQ
jgi:lysosomal Pro-X carboxypeptidase